MVLKAILGLAIGIPFGYLLQRGRYCMNTAFQDLLIARDVTILRTFAAAVGVQLVLVNLLGQLGIIKLSMPPFFWLAALVGGFIFGIGAALAGGCSSGSCYRIGEGLVGSFFAVVAFAIGVSATDTGILRWGRDLLRASRMESASISSLLGVDPWVVIAVLTVAIAWWLTRRQGKRFIFDNRLIKYGLALGVVGTVAWLASSAVGRSFGISVVQPLGSIMGLVAAGDIRGIGFGTFAIIGLVLGSFISAKRKKEFSWRAPGPRSLMQQFGGGLLMGFGGATAGGCTVGHGLTGVPILSATSWLAMVSIMLGIWTTAYIRFKGM